MQKRIFKTYKHFTGERSAARAQFFIGIVLILFCLIFFGAEPEDIPAQSRYRFASYFYILPAKILGDIITTGIYVIIGLTLTFSDVKKARKLKKQERTFRKWGVKISLEINPFQPAQTLSKCTADFRKRSLFSKLIGRLLDHSRIAYRVHEARVCIEIGLSPLPHCQ